MTNEQDIAKAFTDKFSLTGEEVRVARERRIFATVPYSRFREALEYARNEIDFNILCTITGQDEGDNLTFMYHMAHKNGMMLNIKTAAPKTNPTINTISDIFPGSIIYERELVDLFGAKVEGLPPGKRYPLPDNWPEGEYPLRKDWKGEK